MKTDSGMCTIAIHKITKCGIRSPKEAVLIALKSAGAPIKGTVYLYPDPDYEWQTEDTFLGIKYKWRRLPNGKSKAQEETQTEIKKEQT